MEWCDIERLIKSTQVMSAEQVVRFERWQCLSVEIHHHKIAAGFYDTGVAFTFAEMSLRGEVHDTRSDRAIPNASVDVEIEFAEEPQFDDEGYECGDEDLPDGIPNGYDLGASYIGHIRVLLQHAGRQQTQLQVKLFLPLRVFPLLMALKGSRIRFVTTHDSLVSPKVELNTYMAAYVKRVEFEPMHD